MKRPVTQRPQRSIEAYAITLRGIGRATLKTHETISYQGAQILGELLHRGKLTLGELTDLCAASTSPIRDEVMQLQADGFVERNDLPA